MAELADELKDWITASGEWDPRLTQEVKQLDADPASSRVRVQGGELGDPVREPFG